ncbi:uncharacterized protein CMU_018570 [Cryptosporidium muris RN66]|uniref:Vps53 N-terminal domain-containing protein n=1 Tax=Cryptosporidium muris (strain RN66) TaxID=441375 RepID=B6AD96_CRYMR|nr:uncharacterized protein CMU_018570 [Cryptosporidium muris RN66]EEA06100.1 hypothetical protein, conserved [Cryptosporidium muris RN66]|eukprot:XP_002140449.1 hypothetical protein [Cryptosporidium muris RN66]
MNTILIEEDFLLDKETERELFKLYGDFEDELQRPEFDTIEYVNKLFPNEQSLTQLDDVLNTLTKRLNNLELEIFQDINELASEDIPEIYNTVMSTLEEKFFPSLLQMDEMSKNALNSINDISDKIHTLDIAQKNLTNTIVLMKRYSMLTTAQKELEISLNNRSYKSMVPLLSVVLRLKSYFNDLIYIEENFEKNLIMAEAETNLDIPNTLSVRQVKGSIVEIDTMISTLKQQIIDDFVALIDPYILFSQYLAEDQLNKSKASPPHLLNAPESFRKQMRFCCFCTDILGTEFRENVIDTFTTKLLVPYRKLFSRASTDNLINTSISTKGNVNNQSTTGLEYLERRFGWYRKCIKEYDQQFGDIFLIQWNVPKILTEKFFLYTKSDLLQILGDVGLSISHLFLIQYSQKCHQFESQVLSRFAQSLQQQQLIHELEATKKTLSENLDIFEPETKFKEEYFITDYKENNTQDQNQSLPNVRGLLTSCFIVYILLYFDSKKRDFTNSIIPNLIENSEILQTPVTKQYMTLQNSIDMVPFIWSSSTILFQQINNILLSIEHMLTFDEICQYFITFIIDIVTKYISDISKIKEDRAENPVIKTRTTNTSLESIVEAVVTTVSQTSISRSTPSDLYSINNLFLEYKSVTLGTTMYLDWMLLRLQTIIAEKLQVSDNHTRQHIHKFEGEGGNEILDEHQVLNTSYRNNKISKFSRLTLSNGAKPKSEVTNNEKVAQFNKISSNHQSNSYLNINGQFDKGNISHYPNNYSTQIYPVLVSLSQKFCEFTCNLRILIINDIFEQFTHPITSLLSQLFRTLNGGIEETLPLENSTNCSRQVDSITRISNVELIDKFLTESLLNITKSIPKIFFYHICSRITMFIINKIWDILNSKVTLHNAHKQDFFEDELDKLSSLLLRLPSLSSSYVPRTYVNYIKDSFKKYSEHFNRQITFD